MEAGGIHPVGAGREEPELVEEGSACGDATRCEVMRV